MKLNIIKLIFVLLILVGLSFADPVITSASVSYASNQITINGTGFVSGQTVTLAGSSLTVTSWSSTQIVATLPTLTVGSYKLAITDGSGNISKLSITYGTTPAGTWASGGVYLAGQAIVRTSDGGSVGPYFNLTGSNAGDPILDTTDWIYCCGLPTLTGSVVFSPSSGSNLYWEVNPSIVSASICEQGNGDINPDNYLACFWGPTSTTGTLANFSISVTPSPTGTFGMYLFESNYTGTGSQLGYCAFSTSQTSCTGTISSSSITSGDYLVWTLESTLNSYTLTSGGPYTISWVISF